MKFPVHEPTQSPAKLKRYVLTGAPGAGKTAIIRQLEVDGFSVVEEAATDIIALQQAEGLEEPWIRDSFIDEIAELQRTRLLHSSYWPGRVQFHDRSIFCTAALSDYLGRPRSLVLSKELERAVAECWFEPEAFFVRSLGFVTPTAARRISLEEAIRFERVHEEVYRDFGFQIIFVPQASPSDRADQIKAFLRARVNPDPGN
jgi:predicted ATPase